MELSFLDQRHHPAGLQHLTESGRGGRSLQVPVELRRGGMNSFGGWGNGLDTGYTAVVLTPRYARCLVYPRPRLFSPAQGWQRPGWARAGHKDKHLTSCGYPRAGTHFTHTLPRHAAYDSRRSTHPHKRKGGRRREHPVHVTSYTTPITTLNSKTRKAGEDATRRQSISLNHHTQRGVR